MTRKTFSGKVSDIDRDARGVLIRTIKSLQAETQAFIDANDVRADNGEQATVSEWQYEIAVIEASKQFGGVFCKNLTRARLRRLEAIGWVEYRASDGCGPQVRLSA